MAGDQGFKSLLVAMLIPALGQRVLFLFGQHGVGFHTAQIIDAVYAIDFERGCRAFGHGFRH